MIDTAPTAALSAGGSERVIQWTRTCAALVLGVAAIGVWWPVLGAGTLWITPVLGLTAAVVGGAVELRDPRLRLAFPWLWLLWTPIAVIVAGLPAWTLNPFSAMTTLREMAQALSVGLRDPAATADPWLLAAWLHLCGLLWFVAASQARRGSRGAAASAFFMLAAPFAAALAFGRTGDAAWQGGALLVGGLLWTTRGNLRDGLPALVTVAAVGVIVAAIAAPTERWSGLDPQTRGKPKFTSLASEQTYGPEKERKTGATMFTVRADHPSLWRMEVLQRFDGHVWSTAADPSIDELPQPSARRTTTSVKVDSMLTELAVGPGRIASISAPDMVGNSRRIGTEAVSLMPSPKTGSEYDVVSDEVEATEDLRDVPVPTGRDYPQLTEVAPPGSGFPNPAVGNLPPELQGTGYGRVTALAEQLSKGARSQLEIVENVDAYLTQSGIFRYSLDVDQPGPYPLLDFLLSTHVGYCQHFAGAAALLLRLAGVPTRVVIGFATGVPAGEGAWKVRDQDAHAWIEVYFPGHGWVAFNPTAAGSEAAIAPGVGTANPDAAKRSVDGAKIPVLLVVGIVALVIVAFLLWRRARAPRRDPDALGDVLAGIVPAPAGPAMTFAELRDDLRAVGPAVTALVDEAEFQRFGPTDRPPEARPRRRVWRALISDVGPLRAARIVILGPGRRPITDGGGPKIASSAPPPSVAPPGSSN